MDNKFRNHPSLMLEQLGVFGVIIITFLISSLDDLDEILGDIKNSDSTTLLIIILVILAVILFRLAVNTIVWYKTWITVDETSITITKNTIFRSVNTIGLRNISNINIERNLLERILGTSTVKIDTESRSTADTTDVTILLRKDKAEALRERLLAGATAAKHTQTLAANEQLDGTAGAAASVPNNSQTSDPTSVQNDGQISDRMPCRSDRHYCFFLKNGCFRRSQHRFFDPNDSNCIRWNRCHWLLCLCSTAQSDR